MNSLASHGVVTHVEEKTIGGLVDQGVIEYPLTFTPEEIRRVSGKTVYEVTVRIAASEGSLTDFEITELLDVGAALFEGADSQSHELLEWVGDGETSPLTLKGSRVPVRKTSDGEYTIQTTDLNALRRWKLENNHLKWDDEHGYVSKIYCIPVKFVCIMIAVSIPIMHGLITVWVESMLQPYTMFAEYIAIAFFVLGVLPMLDLMIEAYKSSMMWLTTRVG